MPFIQSDKNSMAAFLLSRSVVVSPARVMNLSSLNILQHREINFEQHVDNCKTGY